VDVSYFGFRETQTPFKPGCNLSELNKERSELISMVVVTSFGSFPCLELDQSNLINFQIYKAKMTRFLGLLCVA
jgi:hypothetical protein